MNQKFEKAAKSAVNKITEEILYQIDTWSGPWPSYKKMTKTVYYPNSMTRKRFFDTMDQMTRSGWVKKIIADEKVSYTITAKGRLRQLALKIIKQKKVKQDSIITLVIFDIPELRRQYRDFLRRLLKQAGFKLLQKSVFLAECKLSKEFYVLIEESGMSKYVLVLEGKIQFMQK